MDYADKIASVNFSEYYQSMSNREVETERDLEIKFDSHVKIRNQEESSCSSFNPSDSSEHKDTSWEIENEDPQSWRYDNLWAWILRCKNSNDIKEFQ